MSTVTFMTLTLQDLSPSRMYKSTIKSRFCKYVSAKYRLNRYIIGYWGSYTLYYIIVHQTLNHASTVSCRTRRWAVESRCMHCALCSAATSALRVTEDTPRAQIYNSYFEGASPNSTVSKFSKHFSRTKSTTIINQISKYSEHKREQ